jgi:hypothetical protein
MALRIAIGSASAMYRRGRRGRCGETRVFGKRAMDVQWGRDWDSETRGSGAERSEGEWRGDRDIEEDGLRISRLSRVSGLTRRWNCWLGRNETTTFTWRNAITRNSSTKSGRWRGEWRWWVERILMAMGGGVLI